MSEHKPLPDARSTKPRAPKDVTHLSFSSVSTFLRCPRQWAYSYLEGLRRPPGVALIKGSAVDKAAAHNFRQKIDSHEDLPKNDVLEVAEDAFRQDVDRNGGVTEIVWDGTNQAKAIDSTISLTSIHMTMHAPYIQPVTVQEELRRQLPGGRDFLGFIDYVKDDGTIGDVKTGNRRMGQDAADSDLQPSAYGYLKGEPIAFEFARLIDTGTRRYEEVVETGRDERAIHWFEGLVEDVSLAIDAKAYPPNPNGWHCSPKFCGYWQRCMVEQRGPEFPE